MKKSSRMLIAAAMVLVLSACSSKDEAKPKETDMKTETEVKESAAETEAESSSTIPETEADRTDVSAGADEKNAAVVKDIDFSEKAENSLLVLRQNMENMPSAVGAAAFLGWYEEGETDAISVWLQNESPGMAAKIPFMEEIPDDHILGGGFGDVYCIVPQKDNLSMEVQSITWKTIGNNIQPEMEEILYKSQKPDPVLVYVRHGNIADETDLRILFTAKDGHTEEFYPILDVYSDVPAIHIPVDADSNPLYLDFTLFGQVGEDEWLTPGDAWWLPPTELGLADTKWCTEDGWMMHLAYDAENPSCAGGAVIYHPYEDETGTSYERDCHGEWWMEENCLYLNITNSKGEFVGGAFPVLTSPSGEELRIEQSYRDQACPPFFAEGTDSMVLHLSYESLQ